MRATGVGTKENTTVIDGYDKEKLQGSIEAHAIGIKLRSRSIEEPLRQIVANAGERSPLRWRACCSRRK